MKSLIFAMGLLFSVVFLRATEASLLRSMQIDTVVSSVLCLVDDPKDLAELLDLKRGQQVLIESLETGSTSLSLNGEVLLPAFPAELLFKGLSFIIDGIENSESATTLHLTIVGHIGQSVEAQNTGEIRVLFQSKTEALSGTATLASCVRLK